MTRVLLALLALLGFAVQAAPATAAANRGAGNAEIGALPIARTQARVVVAQVERFVAPASSSANPGRVSALPAPRQSAARVPTVLTGIDRARE